MEPKSKFILFLSTLAFFIMASFESNSQTTENNEFIQPYSGNPFYWQYKEKPVLLIGGSWQDNLFNHPMGLSEHLDLLVSVGGNYVRNTMSHRNIGNVFAYSQNAEGLFDLDKFNEEYWTRFENFLQLAYDRDIIVQIEIWETWDHYENHQSIGGWSFHPFNPANNINYSTEETDLPQQIDYPPTGQPSNHPFFRSVPKLDNNEVLLAYQTKLMDKILSYSFKYPNVLYCMNNETGEHLEWGDYWARYLKSKANEAALEVYITDMRRNEKIRSEDHHHIYKNPDLYTFLDISQNNAWEGLGQKHYDNIMFVRDFISNNPRPINNVKNYGAVRHGEEESIARFCRIIFAGCASARFHRPHPLEDPEAHEAATEFGLGLSPQAQAIIKSMDRIIKKIDFVDAKPNNDLLSDREENEAYLLENSGKQYAVYLPKDAGDGSVTLDMSGTKGTWEITWLNMKDSNWQDQKIEIIGGNKVKFQKPDSGHWVALILPRLNR